MKAHDLEIQETRHDTQDTGNSSFHRRALISDGMDDGTRAEVNRRKQKQMEIQDALRKQMELKENEKRQREAERKAEEQRELERIQKDQAIIKERFERELEEQRKKDVCIY